MWCGLTYDQLLDVERIAIEHYGEADYPQKTMRDIVEDLVKPQCAKTGTGWASHKNAGDPKLVQVFVTHAWSERFKEFVDSVRAMLGCMFQKPVLYICAFAIYQGNDEDIEAALDTPIEACPFVKAMKCATTFAIVKTDEVDLWSRGWCWVEAFYARKFRLLPDHVLVHGSKKWASSKKGAVDFECFKTKDKRKILRFVTSLPDSEMDEIEEHINQLRKL